MEERASKSLYNGEISGVEKEGDILLSCHDPSKHGRVHLLSQTKTLDVRDGKEYYYYYALKAPFVEPTSAGHNWADIIRSTRKFKYVWGVTCPIWSGSNFNYIFDDIMRNCYLVLVDGGMVIFPSYGNIRISGEALIELFSHRESSKGFSMRVIESNCMPVWLEVEADEPAATNFFVFTKLPRYGGRRRKTMRKRGRRLTKL